MTDQKVSDASTPLITRIQWPDDGTSPLAGMVLVFGYREGTDAFHYALREAYPEYETVKERKCMAAIDYLRAELSSSQSKAQNSSSDRCNAQSPTFYTPEALTEDTSRHASLSAATSPAAFALAPASPKDSSQRKQSSTTRPSFDHGVRSTKGSAQEFVFSALDLQAVPQKRKRKMTPDERTNYRETRKRGACKRCRQQKGKCTHLSETDGQGGNKSSDHSKPTAIRQPRTPGGTDPSACLEKITGLALGNTAIEQSHLGPKEYEELYTSGPRAVSSIKPRRMSKYAAIHDESARGYVPSPVVAPESMPHSSNAMVSDSQPQSSQVMAPDPLPPWYPTVPNFVLPYNGYSNLGPNSVESGGFPHYQVPHGPNEQNNSFQPNYDVFDPSWTNSDHNVPAD